ncbi:unnamed protein product [Clonostachys byssicola]|uniref:Cytochrome P450 family protein n=1 Tax=Clonostachys byssicola TaxID=160290 RepID=A0A9N9UE74_9HYPO|nr:unnamed protein product [Clonostachys byssicola]
MTLLTVLDLVLALSLTFIAGNVIYALFLSPYRNIPGPRLCKITRYWAIYQDLRLRRISKIHEWHCKYGDVVLIAPGEVSFSSPAPTRDIYGCSGRHPKSSYFDNLTFYGQRPIFCVLGVGEHRQMCKRTFAFYQPSSIYKPAVLQPLRTNVSKIVDRLKRDMEARLTVDAMFYCNLYSLDNITRLAYGPELCAHSIDDENCEERAILAGWKEVEVWNNLAYIVPTVHKITRAVLSYTRGDPTFLSAEERLTDWNMDKIMVSQRNPGKIVPGSLLHQLSYAKTPEGEPYPVPWIAAEMLDNIHAAQTTVALALTFLLWDLACSPEWQDRVRTELLSLPINEDDGLPTFDSIMACPILDACFRESGRLHPLSSGRAERVVPTTKAYSGIILPAGTLVSTSTLAIHYRPDVFPDPHMFKPDRWLEADGATLQAMEACYMPFGYGARLCLGKAFAVAEIKQLVAGVLLAFSVRRDPQSETTTDWTMEQLGSQNAMPRGRRCDLGFHRLAEREWAGMDGTQVERAI